jgi:hypothetical protein
MEVLKGKLHLSLIGCLMVAFAQAPLQHAHRDDPAHSHAGGDFTHLHLPTAPTDVASWTTQDPNNDAQLIEWVFGDGSGSLKIELAPARLAAHPPLAPSGDRVIVPSPSGHDPPGRSVLPPRAPPV